MLFCKTNNDEEVIKANTRKSVIIDENTKNDERKKKECGIKTLYNKTSGPILKLFLWFHCLIGTNVHIKNHGTRWYIVFSESKLDF